MSGCQKLAGGVGKKIVQLAHGVPGPVVFDVPIPPGGPLQRPGDLLFQC